MSLIVQLATRTPAIPPSTASSTDSVSNCVMRCLRLAPIDRRLIEMRMLTTKERVWLDSYHARVHEVIGPLVDKPTRTWLTAATRSLP